MRKRAGWKRRARGVSSKSEKVMIASPGVKQHGLTELNGFPSRSIHRYRLLLTPRMAMRSLVSAFSEITPAGDRDKSCCQSSAATAEPRPREGGELTVGAPGRGFAHGAVQADLQVEVVQVRGRLQVDVPPRVPPVGANQRRRVRSCLAEVEALEDGEQQRQHGVSHPESPVYVHHGAKSDAFPLRLFRCSVVPEFGDSSYLKPAECHSCSHPRRKKKKEGGEKLAPKADVRLSAAEGPHPPLSVYSDALGQDWTLIFGDKSPLTFRIIPRPHPNAPVVQVKPVLCT